METWPNSGPRRVLLPFRQATARRPSQLGLLLTALFDRHKFITNEHRVLCLQHVHLDRSSRGSSAMDDTCTAGTLCIRLDDKCAAYNFLTTLHVPSHCRSDWTKLNYPVDEKTVCDV